MQHNGKIEFMFDYSSSPIWLHGDNCGPWLVSSEGYFDGDLYNLDGEKLDCKLYDERLKGEVELEQKVQLIYDVYCRIWNINNFGTYKDPYIGFENEQEKTEFFDACDYVIKRMREIFGDEFTVHKPNEQIIAKRSLGCRKK